MNYQTNKEIFVMKNTNFKLNKTKFLALFVLIAMLATSIALVGCEFDIGKTEGSSTTSSSSTASDENPPVEELVFEHGDNFTEDDIEFVKYFHKYEDMIIEPKIYSCSDVFDNTKNNKGYLYFVDVDIENSYYICGYIDLNIEENSLYYGWVIDVEKYKWYKFNDKASIPNEMEGLSLGISFEIYDATVIKDVGNDVDCSHKFKFYTFGWGMVRGFREIYENMFYYHWAAIENMNIAMGFDISTAL